MSQTDAKRERDNRMGKLFTDATVAQPPGSDRSQDVGDPGPARAQRHERRHRPEGPASGEHRRHTERRRQDDGDAERAPDHRQRAVALLQRTGQRVREAVRDERRKDEQHADRLPIRRPGRRESGQRDQDRAQESHRETHEPAGGGGAPDRWPRGDEQRHRAVQHACERRRDVLLGVWKHAERKREPDQPEHCRAGAIGFQYRATHRRDERQREKADEDAEKRDAAWRYRFESLCDEKK